MQASPDAGKALPSPFKNFPSYGIYHRRGQVSLVAAASGGGKSAYAAHVAVHARYPDGSPVPTLYCSMDSDFVTLGSRVAASVINEQVSEVERLLRAKDQETWGRLHDATGHIWWFWDNEPSLRDLMAETEAYGYVTGAWPHLIVIDNLINLDAEGEAGFQQKDSVMAWLQKLAARTNAHIMVLQHVTKAYTNGIDPIPKVALLDSVDKRPRLILTMHRIDELHVGVRVVKNSTGRAAGDASWGPDLGVQFERSYMTGG